VAVGSLWLGAEEGECFGLLGVNGAGKTTAFRMVTGELYPDAGDVTVCGASIRHQRTAARQRLGYCPQYDALPGALTGREVLTMYARLRGVRPADVCNTVEELLQRLQLVQYADRVCDSYSGGTKRKLSVAVALVGQPPVVLMDEPSTGMDPAARRFMWSSIQSGAYVGDGFGDAWRSTAVMMFVDVPVIALFLFFPSLSRYTSPYHNNTIVPGVMAMGHTVLLTSHSMEECEALCGRIGILKAGALQCVGSVQHLKNRFGAGYRLLVRAAPDKHAAVTDFVLGACPEAQWWVTDPEHVRFTMPRATVDLPGLFEGVEAQR
jgi:ABC-type multidrug transport system ATPase subunit